MFILNLKRLRCPITVFLFGAFVYGTLEIIWRGFTHPTMLFLGGTCLVVIYALERSIGNKAEIVVRSFLYALMITAAEFLCGIIFNIVMKLDVWDYSALPCNFLGQVCLEFFLVWFLLAVLCCHICKIMRYALS